MNGTITVRATGEVRDADGNLVSSSPVEFQIPADELPPEVVQAIIEQQEAGQ